MSPSALQGIEVTPETARAIVALKEQEILIRGATELISPLEDPFQRAIEGSKESLPSSSIIPVVVSTSLSKQLSPEDMRLAVELKEQMFVSNRELHMLPPAKDATIKAELLQSPMKKKQETVERQTESSKVLLQVPSRRAPRPTTRIL